MNDNSIQEGSDIPNSHTEHECEHFLLTDVAVYECECGNLQTIDTVGSPNYVDYVRRSTHNEIVKSLLRRIAVLESSPVSVDINSEAMLDEIYSLAMNTVRQKFRFLVALKFNISRASPPKQSGE